MKQLFKPVLTVSILIGLFSCNNSDKKTDDAQKTPADTATTVTTAPAQSGPAVPFDVVEIYHNVKNYDTWRSAFNMDSTMRQANGLRDIAVGRGVDNSNSINIVLMVSDMTKAKAFAADPRLKEVMDKAGVVSKPEMDYWHVIKYNGENEKAGAPWVEVTHKVKDYDAWVKVFDAEGSATRAGYGLADLVVARGIDDANMVHIVFVITDMAKAKARMNDPALKKLMTDAGVEGKPKIEIFNDTSK